MEVLRGAAATLRFPGPDDDPVSFAGTVVVTVSRHSDGSAIATKAATQKHTEGETSYFTYELSGADTAEVDLVVAVWSDGNSSYTTYTEIVGGQVTSLKAILDHLGEDRPPDTVAAARESATRDIEGACAVAFRARYGREVLDGSGTNRLLLRQPRLQRVLAVTVGGVGVDPAELTVDPVGVLVRNSSIWTAGAANVAVAYVHGYETFPAAALPVRDFAAYLLTPAPTDWNARATAHTTPDGSTYSLVTAGVRGASFPLPAVNAFVERNEYVVVG